MSNDDNNVAMKALLVEKVVRRAKQKDGGRTSCPSNQWSIIAQAVVHSFFDMPQSGPFEEENAVEAWATRVLSSVRQSFKSSKSFIVPDVCPISASGMEKGENASHKRKYEETTMGKSDSFGAFVSVKSYTQFCLDMTSNLVLKEKSMQIIRQPIEALFPREQGRSTPSEKPRSAQLARLLQSELAELGVECVHQLPIVPHNKPKEQDVDVGFIAHGAIAAILEYKPVLNFSAFLLQSSVYGSDTIASFKRPCLMVQVRGDKLESLEIRAYGVVINFYETPSHKRSLLLDAKGMNGLKLFISGLKGYLRSYTSELAEQWHQGYLSNVVSVHEGSGPEDDAIVRKAYDYRLRAPPVPPQDQRYHNIDLVREFIDPDAKLMSMDGLDIVSTKFLKRTDGETWYGKVKSERLAKIVRKLKSLHEKNYVHGDIRLRNMVLHEGVLTDFDYTRETGSNYPSTLLDIEGDGVRHPDVAEAIQEQFLFERMFESNEEKYRRAKRSNPRPRIGQLKMMCDHDVYAMKYVLQKFQPVDENRTAEWDTIVQSEDLWAMPNLLDAFDGHVRFTAQIDVGYGAKPSTGTGSPGDKEQHTE